MPLVTAMRPDGATFRVSREDAERAGWTVVSPPEARPAEPKAPATAAPAPKGRKGR